MRKLLDWIMYGLKVLCTLLIAVFVTIVIVSVFFRYVLNDSLTWSEQVSRYLFVWMIMLGMPIIYREKITLSFDMIFNVFPKNMQKVVSIILDVVIAFFGAFMGTQGIRYIIKMGGNILPGIGIPQWLIYISQPIGGYLLTIVAIESAILGISCFTKKNDPMIDLMKGCDN